MKLIWINLILPNMHWLHLPGCNRRGWEYFSSQVLPQFSTVGIKTNVEKISWRCVTFQRCFVEEHCGENNDGFIEKDTSISRMKQELSFMLHHSIVILLSRFARYLFFFSVYIEFCTINLFRDQITFCTLFKKKK